MNLRGGGGGGGERMTRDVLQPYDPPQRSRRIMGQVSFKNVETIGTKWHCNCNKGLCTGYFEMLEIDKAQSMRYTCRNIKKSKKDAHMFHSWNLK